MSGERQDANQLTSLLEPTNQDGYSQNFKTVVHRPVSYITMGSN